MQNDDHNAGSGGRIVQLFGILVLVGLLALILHKAVADVSRLASLHSGGAFWSALGRYLMANLAG